MSTPAFAPPRTCSSRTKRRGSISRTAARNFPRRRPERRSASQRLVERVCGTRAARIANGATRHSVHHEREAEPGILIDDDERAAPATPETRIGVRTEWHHVAREPIAHPETHRHTEHEIHAVRLLVEDAFAARFRQQSFAERLATVRERGLRHHDRTRVAVTVRCGYL